MLYRLPLKVYQLTGLFLLTAFYSGLVLMRHYAFESHGHDLAIFDQGLWHYSRLEPPYSSLKGYSLLGDHFTPVLGLLAPFYWLWNAPETLLILQVVVILSGVWPVYWLSRTLIQSSFLQLFPPLFYSLFFGVQATLDFDFHTDGLAAAFFMWAIWACQTRRTGFYLLMLLLVVLCKETMPVYLSFWAAYNWLIGRQRRLHLGLGLAGVGLFLVELNLVLPWLAGRPYYYTDYGELGQGLGQAVLNSLLHPERLFKALFGNQTKLQSWLVFFVASGGALLLRPGLLLMAVPNVLERFLNPQPDRWTLYFQYSVILTPFFTYAAIEALACYEKWSLSRKPAPGWLGVWLAVVLGLNCLVFSNFWSHGLENFSRLENPATRAALKLIPASASVVANSRLVPHLAHRDRIDELYSPEPPHAGWPVDFVIISLEIERRPAERAQLALAVEGWRQQPAYHLIFEQAEVFVFKADVPETLP